MSETSSSVHSAQGEKKERQEEPEPSRLHCAWMEISGRGFSVSSLRAKQAHFVSAAKLEAELASPLPCAKLLDERTIK